MRQVSLDRRCTSTIYPMPEGFEELLASLREQSMWSPPCSPAQDVL